VAVQNVSNTQATIPVIIAMIRARFSVPGNHAFHYKPMANTTFVLVAAVSLYCQQARHYRIRHARRRKDQRAGIRTTPLTTNTGVNTLTLTTVPALANIRYQWRQHRPHYNGGRLADHVRIGQHGYKRGASDAETGSIYRCGPIGPFIPCWHSVAEAEGAPDNDTPDG